MSEQPSQTDTTESPQGGSSWSDEYSWASRQISVGDALDAFTAVVQCCVLLETSNHPITQAVGTSLVDLVEEALAKLGVPEEDDNGQSYADLAESLWTQANEQIAQRSQRSQDDGDGNPAA